jgi:hypothetical protein
MPLTPEQVFAQFAIARAEQSKQAEKIEQPAVVEPPNDRQLVAHLGAVCVEVHTNQPLPAQAVAWGWYGAPRWFFPYEWPWGQRTRPEEVLARAAFREANAREKVQGGFSMAGRVKNLTTTPRAVEHLPRLPSGFQVTEEDGDG